MIGHVARWIGWLALTLAAGGLVLLIAWAVQDIQQEDAAAEAAGFADAKEMKNARDSGVTDAKAWHDRLAAVRAAEAEKKRNPASKMEVENLSWKLGGFGSVAVVSLTISNANDFAVKDFMVTCSFSGKSGTHIGTAAKTIYEVIKPKAKRSFSDISLGFIDGQSARANCFIGLAGRA